MPLQFRSHHVHGLGLFPLPSLPPCPNHHHHYRLPAHHQTNPRYWNRLVHTHTSSCYSIYPPCLVDDPMAAEQFIAEQWYLARPSAPSLASLHQSRRAILRAREQKYGWWMLVGCFLSFVIGTPRGREETLEPGIPRKSIGEMVWENVKAVGSCVNDFLGYGVAVVYQGIKKIDWSRVWQAAVLLYVVYIWGKSDDELHTQRIASRHRAVSELSQSDYEGVKYTLRPDVQSWCEYPHEPSAQASADTEKLGACGNFLRSEKAYPLFGDHGGSSKYVTCTMCRARIIME